MSEKSEFGRGFDRTNLQQMRAFYLAYPILDAVRPELSWTHYRLLLRVEKLEARKRGTPMIDIEVAKRYAGRITFPTNGPPTTGGCPFVARRAFGAIAMPGIPKTCSASFRAGRIRIWLLIAGALMVCVLAALLAVACQRRLADSNAHACYANLFQIDWCLNTYYLKHSTYPPPPGEPATAPAASWRALAVGAVDAGFTYNVREAWDGPHNRRLIRSGDGSIFWCPRALGTVNRTGKTPYLAVVGAGTVWSEVRLGHIRDPETAVPDKIIVIEVPHSDVYWTEPRDLSMDEAIELYRRENGFKDGRHPHGLHYLTAGGQVHSFDEISSVEEFASLLKAAQ